MSLQLYGKNDSILNAYVGKAREITVSETDFRPRTHDGLTAGGFKLAFLSELVALQTTVGTFSSQITTNANNITSLQSTVSTHTTNISTLQSTVSGHTSSISTLQTTVTTNSSNIATLQANVATLQTTTGTQTTDIADLKATRSKVLGQSGVKRSFVAAASTFTSVSYADNGSGKIRLESSGVHDLTSEVSLNAFVYVAWSGNSSLDGIQKIIAIPDTTHIDIDMNYVAGYGTPTVTLAGSVADVIALSIPAGVMDINSSLAVHTAYSAASGGGTKESQFKLNDTYIDSNGVPSGGAQTKNWNIFNRGALNSQIYTYGDSYTSTFSVDTSVTVVLKLQAFCANANDPCTLEAYRVVLHP